MGNKVVSTVNMVKGKDGVLIVAANTTKILKPDYQYEFTKVILESESILTVNEWNPRKKIGGTLLIKSLNEFVIKDKAKIDLNGKGYRGGTGNHTGESYQKKH
eukprot:247077_1